MNGRTFSQYKILRKLGAGGMGEVYLAEDTKLKREVAIKFLPEEVRSDPERLRRFRTEAEAAARLNHPNIATIHSIEEVEQDGTAFITMEYVDGETLGSRIGKTGVALDTFFDWFVPLSDALAHAHELGRVHRDLKPANIMIRKDGTPKILDFGLARIESERQASEDSEAPTRVDDDAPPSLTQAGSLVGTPAYMSPEQIEGKKLDARTDVFSLGVVMYEALTGERPFKGNTVESIIARILELDPEPIPSLKPVTPRALWSRIRRCLKKDRELRVPTARILHDELRDVREELEAGEPSMSGPPVWVSKTVVVAAVVALAAGALAARFLRPAPSEPLVRKWEIPLPSMSQGFLDNIASISTDGGKIAYIQDNRLWIRDLGQLEPREIPGTDGAIYHFWSPRSDAVGYFNESGLHTVSVDGGPSLKVSEIALTRFSGGGAVWRSDDTILLTTGGTGGIFEMLAVSVHGGVPRTFAEPDTGNGVRDFHTPGLVPNGRGVLVAAHMTPYADEILLLTEDGYSSVVQHPGEWLVSPIFTPSGHVVYSRGGDRGELWAVQFSLAESSVIGNPFRVADRGRSPSVSEDGTLAYLRGGDLMQIVWVDLDGRVRGTIGQPQPFLSNPSLDPDGQRVVALAFGDDKPDLWLHDDVRTTRVTNDSGFESEPGWSPDGSELLFRKSGTINAIADDGSGVARVVARGSDASWSRDGRYLVYQVFDSETQRDLWYVPMGEASPEPVPWMKTPYNDAAPQISPDADYVAFVSDRSGQIEIYVVDFPAQQERTLVSTGGGAYPRWSPRGDALFYVEENRMMRVAVSTGSTFRADEPEPLFTAESAGVILVTARGSFDTPSYDVHPDGDRFVMVGATEDTRVVVVENWAREFEDTPSN